MSMQINWEKAKNLWGLSEVVVSYAQVSAITQEPNENPIAFLEWLREALQMFTNLDLDS